MLGARTGGGSGEGWEGARRGGCEVSLREGALVGVRRERRRGRAAGGAEGGAGEEGGCG